MNNKLKGLTAYPCSPYQTSISNIEDFCFSKSACQFPIYMLTSRKLDKNIFLQAFNQEIRRNDSLRMRIYRSFKGKKMYFLPEYSVSDIDVWDYSQASMDELMAHMQKASCKKIHKNRKIFEIALFHAPYERDGIFFLIHHLAMDLAAVMIFFRDLLQLYDCFEKGTPMPEPLASFEEILKRDIKLGNDQKKQQKLLNTLLAKTEIDGQSMFYAGIDRMRELEKYRKKKRDSTIRFRPFNLFFGTKVKYKSYIVNPEETKYITDYCSAKNTSLASLLTLALRIYLSKWNEKTEDVSFQFLIHRRATLKEKNTGGCMVNSLLFRTFFSNHLSFEQALKHMDGNLLTLLHCRDLVGSKFSNYMAKRENRPILSDVCSCVLSIIPPNAFETLEGWDCQFDSFGMTNLPLNPYFMVYPAGTDGSMIFAFMYQLFFFVEKDIYMLFEGILKVLHLGIDNSQMSLIEIMDQL